MYYQIIAKDTQRAVGDVDVRIGYEGFLFWFRKTRVGA
jgi:hypothetical protein